MNETFQSTASGAASGGPLLELDGVQKSFGAVRALRSGTLRVDPGSIHALVGENGAGKSTLVKIVAAVDPRHDLDQRRLPFDRGVQGGRYRGDLPGADPVP